MRQRGIDRLAERQPRAGIEAAARAFDPDVLTIGFARRTATYKRIGLLSHDPARTLALLAGPPPVQFVLAGKAHPSDEEGKRVVQEMFRFKDAPHVAVRTSCTCTTITWGWPRGSCVAAICGSTCRARQWRPAGRAG
jgi:glycogen phosphorylase